MRPGTAGFEVELSRLPHLPRTLADAAQQRLEHGLAACSAEAISVAWLATLLPPRFDPDQLAQAAGTLGVSQPVAAISELRRARILRVGARGAGFATMALQRALRAQLEAQEPTVQRALAGAAADALGRVLTLPQRIERGRLLKVAGRDHEARKLLEQTAWNLHMRGIRLDLVRSAATWLVELADEDPGLRARAKALQSRAEERMGNLAAAVETALEAVALARTCDDPFVLQEALASAVYPLGQSGRRAEARRLGEESLVLARTLGQPDPLRRALFQLAFFLAVNGDPERGLELLDEAETLTDERHPSALINVAIGRSTANSELGRLDEALDAARDAATLARSWGSLLHRSRAQTSLGSLLQGCGDFEGAAAAYEQVVEVNRLMGVVRLTPRANLATIRIELGQNDQAVALLRSVLPHAQAMSQGPLIHAVHCFLLPALAGVGDWEAVDRCLEDLAEARRTVGYSERGLARFLDLGAERCEAAGHRDRAVLAWTEARAMWAKLGRDDRVAVADAALAR